MDYLKVEVNQMEDSGFLDGWIFDGARSSFVFRPGLV